ncbi:oxygenase MpaB family protein, partial [Acinetobacter sp. A11]
KKRMKLLGLPQQSASWFAYYLIVRNSLLYNGAKLSPKVEKFLSKSGRNIQKLGLTLYQNQGKAKTLASMHQ